MNKKEGVSSLMTLEILNSKDDFEKQLGLCINNNLITDKVCRLFAVWCFRDTLNWVKNPLKESVNAANVAERYAYGLTNDDELGKVQSAAQSAARSSLLSEELAWSAESAVWSAASSAKSAVWSAAWSAAWSATRSAVWSATRSAKSAESARSVVKHTQREALITLLFKEWNNKLNVE